MGSKVSKHLGFMEFIQQYVLQFEISVCDALLVTVLDSVDDLLEHVPGTPFTHAFLHLHKVEQFSIGYVLHGNAKVLGIFKTLSLKRNNFLKFSLE